MHALRRLIARRRGLTALLFAAALALRLLVPTGFMPDVAGGTLSLILCPAADPAPQPVAMPGMHHHDAPHERHSASHDGPCAFAGLSLAPLLPVDPLLLAAAIVLAMALARTRAAQALPRRAFYIHPPSRGPPAIA